MKTFITSLSLLFALFLGGCGATENSRATGQVIDDAAITAKVNTEIAQAAGLGKAVTIDVDTYRGVVSLGGFVNSKEQIQMATQAARRVNGVMDVRNNLEVKPKP